MSLAVIQKNAIDSEEDGTPVRIPHIGNVDIGNNVEIGANTVIARGTLSSTTIKNDE